MIWVTANGVSDTGRNIQVVAVLQTPVVTWPRATWAISRRTPGSSVGTCSPAGTDYHGAAVEWGCKGLVPSFDSGDLAGPSHPGDTAVVTFWSEISAHRRLLH